ncbi:hypothetical protein FQN57_005988 [Myotisia sp. PD_48]|nr:hypothetical protein FQN57_005988 [Myotisia sp. PD_48]
MGQTASTQRLAQENTGSENASLVRNDRDGRDDRVSDALTSRQAGEGESPSSNPHPQAMPSLFRSGTTGETNRTAASRIETGNLQPFVSHSRSTTHNSTASTASRRSRMSRLGTRILPNSVLRNLLSSGEETAAEGSALRNGLLSRSLPRSDPHFPTGHFSSLRSLSSRGIARRRSIRGPYAFPRGESALLPESPPNLTFLDNPSNTRNTHPSRLSWRYRERLNHVRHSISSPISNMFTPGAPSPEGNHDTSSSPPRRPSRAGISDDSDRLLPSLVNTGSSMDIDEFHDPDVTEPASQPNATTSPTAVHPPSATPGTRAPRTIIRERRERAARLLRREEQTPLSRILQLAAAAIAAQLSGSTNLTVPDIQAVGADSLNGPLESLVQGIQQASAREDGNNGESPRDPNMPHVNFLRVFRFINNDPPSTRSSADGGNDHNGDQMDVDGPEATEEDRRLLTLVVVGVRAMPSNNNTGSGGEGTNNRLNVESLLRLPFLAPSNFLRSDRPGGGILRRADGRSRFSPRRYSVGGSTLGSSSEGHRQYRSQTSSRRQSDTGLSNDLSSSLPTALSDSPQGPHPPPSTPADPGLSRVPSAANTPSRRPSSASAILPQLNEDSAGEPDDSLTEQSANFSSSRQRRRSDSEAARHRGLGSGSARRNGVVEPDSPSPSTGRSWLIYVVGTNLTDNNAAFAAPSLFTDDPTYEDMMLLSSLLGPVKPPIATQDEVSAAGGLYRLVEYSGALIAENPETNANIPIAETDRCLICLSDYEAGEEIRLLNQCKHLYHRDCIDEWLTTGRNSCPLCRGEGVSLPTNSAESTNDEAAVS